MKFTAALTLLCFGTVNLVLGDSDDACVEIFQPEYVDELCCNNLESIDMFYDDLEECNKNATTDDLTCADYECLLNKRGLLEDGKIIDDKATEMMDEIAKKYPKETKTVERLKMACLEGQYEEYPTGDNCMALKFHVCVYTNVMLECDSWKKNKICNKVFDLVKKCKEAK